MENSKKFVVSRVYNASEGRMECVIRTESGKVVRSYLKNCGLTIVTVLCEAVDRLWEDSGLQNSNGVEFTLSIKRAEP